MGNFFITVSKPGAERRAGRTFQSGLRMAQRLAFPAPNRVVEADWVCAASFPRENGSGTPVTVDPKTGSWLAAIGTWFHRQTAEAALLTHYLESDADAVARELEGFFVIVIGDARTKEVFVITDLVGSCHCFLRRSDAGLALSGSSLLLGAFGGTTIDPIACQEFLRTGIVYEDRTIHAEVKKLGPASVFRLHGGVLADQKAYWRITDLVPESLNKEQAAEQLWDSLVHGATRISRRLPRIACDLTGGYDSRVVAAALAGAAVNFTAVVSGPPDSPDVIISRGLAAQAGLPHRHLQPDTSQILCQVDRALMFTDGEYDAVEYARIAAIHETLRGDLDVSLNGSFGEVARGYWWELLFPRAGAIAPLDGAKLARRRYAAQSEDASLFAPQQGLDLVAHFAGIIEHTTEGLAGLPNTVQMDYTYLAMRMQRWQGRIASSTNRIWPLLSPFMLRSVLEVMLQAKSGSRRRSLLVRRMLTEFQPRWAEFPLEHGQPATPITWRNALRFTPLARYFATKVSSRALRMAGLQFRNHNDSFELPPLRLQLWARDNIRDVLDPARMTLKGFLDAGALRNFLASSHQRDFTLDACWQRLLTLESAFRALSRAREGSED